MKKTFTPEERLGRKGFVIVLLKEKPYNTRRMCLKGTKGGLRMTRLKQRNKRDAYSNIPAENLSKEDMIYIQEEAYYRALKRIETEKAAKENEVASGGKRETIQFLLRFLIFPWGIKKKLKS